MQLNLPTGHYPNGIHGGMMATPNTLAAAGIGRDMIRPETLASTSYQRTREMTIDELLLENRVVFLIGEINHASAARVMMQMLYLESQKRGQDINFYINSPGGAVDDTLAIYDTILTVSQAFHAHCAYTEEKIRGIVRSPINIIVSLTRNGPLLAVHFTTNRWLLECSIEHLLGPT